MASTFYLEMVSPQDIFYSGNARQIILPGLDGAYGVLPNHEPMVTAITAGIVRYQDQEGRWHMCVASDGCVEVRWNCWVRTAPPSSAPRTSTATAPWLPSTVPRSACAKSRASTSTSKPRPPWPGPWPA